MDALVANAELRTVLTDLQTSRYNALAAATIIIFDHFITLGQEKEHPSWGSALFVFNRYHGLFTAVSLLGPMAELDGVFAMTAITQVMLILRLRAMYLNDRIVTIMMLVAFVLSMISCTVIMREAIQRISGCSCVSYNMHCTITHNPILSGLVTSMNLPGREFCVQSKAPLLLSAYFIPVFLLELFLAGLALVRWIREAGFILPTSSLAPAFLRNLVLDSAIYFLVITMAYAMNIFLWIFKPVRAVPSPQAKVVVDAAVVPYQEVPELPIGFVTAMTCVMGDRLILNIRCRRLHTIQHPSITPPEIAVDSNPGRV
ncbi:hypothetical protein EVG20_g5521 [Dentipellis fragilis]|uniref:DUF6533 domain-containing protein n=1 Tax=Dentipellis fragilis TaxID=205917 RepID=A0A4Y9YV29_9AGAM|nr:hypothetical protein EVG20_g5521 [Dentipellis fragilis]